MATHHGPNREALAQELVELEDRAGWRCFK